MLARGLSLVVFVSVASCNAIAGIEEPVLSNTSTPTNTAPSERASRFLGEWTSVRTRSTETLVCNGVSQDAGGTYRFSITSSGGDLIQARITTEASCSVVLQVTDDVTAKFEIGSRCTFDSGLDLVYSSGLMKLVPADEIKEANVELGGRDEVNRCDYEGRLLLQKNAGGG